MKTKTPVNAIKSRIIIPIQSIGRCGKSTMLQLVQLYLMKNQIESACIDLDGEHKTFSKWFSNVNLLPLQTAEDMGKIFNYCGNNPTEILDVPAQATSIMLEAFEKFNAKELFEEKGVRLTIPIFASDEIPAMQAALQIILATKDFADFVVVKNPARFTSRVFEASKLMELLKDSPIIELKKISDSTLEEIAKVNRANRKEHNFEEIIPLLPIASRMEMGVWLKQAYTQFQANAALFVATPEALTSEVPEKAKQQEETMSVYDL